MQTRRGKSTKKGRFDIKAAIRRLRKAVAPYPRAALFELAAEGHTSVFEQLVACIISIRTRDDTVSTRGLSCTNLNVLRPLR